MCVGIGRMRIVLTEEEEAHSVAVLVVQVSPEDE
jgi:hypothetical protein